LILTIITPVYNGARYLEACIENVASQWVEGIEHLIMDGGSLDGSLELLQELALKYPHLRWISEKDKGQSDAMNKAILLAKGTWISFLNVDDFYEPQILPVVLKKIKDGPKTPCLFVGNLKIWNEKEELISVNRPSGMSLPLMLADICEWPFNPSAYFYPVEVHKKVGSFPVDEHFAMDYDFIFKVLVAHIPIYYFDEIWGNFRLLPEAKTGKDQAENSAFNRSESIRQKYYEQSSRKVQIQVWFLRKLWAIRNKIYGLVHR